MVFLVSPFPPLWMLMYFFAGFFSNLTLYMTKLRVPGSGAVLRFYGPVAICSSYLFQNIAKNVLVFPTKLQLCSRSVQLSPIKTSRFFFFSGKFSHCGGEQKKKKSSARRQVWFKGFFVEKMCQSHQILRKRILESPYLLETMWGAGLQQVAKT